MWADRDRAQDTASGDLYVVRADEAEPRRVLAWPGYGVNGGPYGTYDASWSPDRKRIALELSVWTDDPSWQVAVVTADGRQLRRRIWPTWTDGDTTWSTDTGALAHSHRGDLWTYVPTTGRSMRIWRAGRPGGAAELGDIEGSPDGRRLAVAMNPSYSSPLRGIVSMSFDGADVVRLTSGDDTDLRWSPDGRRIAFVRGENIYVVGADGRGLRRLTSDGSSGPIGWSPDGSKILFERETWDEDRPQKTWWELWIMDADGGRQTRLPFNRPRWSVISADWE